MKLCRFVLDADPSQPRSGIFHDGKVYETNGETAIGIHEPGTLRLLPPLGTPPVIRVIESAKSATGEPFVTYRYANPAGLAGPNGEIEVFGRPGSLDFEAHVAFVVSDSGVQIEPGEAASFVLGYCLVVFLCDADLAQEERSLGIGVARSHDLGTAVGPYLTTPDDLVEFSTGSDPSDMAWNFRIKVNETTVATGQRHGKESAHALVSALSALRPIAAGEVVAMTPLETPSVESSLLGRPLLPGDRLEVNVDGLGTLVVRIA